MRYLILLMTLFITSPALADWFHTLARYECNQAADALLLSYLGAYNEDGEALLAKAGENEWNPWSLLEIQDDTKGTYVTGIKSIERSCKLSDGIYVVIISGQPGNTNILGRCGAQATASVKIIKNNNPIYTGSFESDCHSGAPVITEIKASPNNSIKITTTPNNDFFK
ncbi:hypothetical protein OU800_09955 [Pseudomonas sp. GOM7]|uniref:hypothetical protein n=1 Tax=Pseudomonas sp. GOM7 TaxID=2998079 RepID=UPI00227CA56B|nr:hypothetical protein [Pseudomonas sp. GOM7]WAJ39528.1 hypothetical protein OU800_09955 [Pseudomonas sp. GOM7]